MFSTRCVSRRASWSMIATDRCRSSSLRTQPSRSISANIRICASGVRSSCDTPDTSSLFTRASCRSRCSCRSDTITSPALSVMRPSTSCDRFHVQVPPATRAANAGRIATRTAKPSKAPVMPNVAAGRSPRVAADRKITRSSGPATESVRAESAGSAADPVGGSSACDASTAGNTDRPADPTSNA